VRHLLDQVNGTTLRLQALICGRPLAVQTAADELRRPGRILHLLPYKLPAREEGYQAAKALKDLDQRDEWWSKYARLTNRPEDGLPGSLRRQELRLDEVTAQPLLNYLVAISYYRKVIDFTKEVNLNEVYKDLIAGVYERTYERREDPRHRVAARISKEHFLRVLEEVAVATWHGNTRVATGKAIEQRFKEAGLEDLLREFQEATKEGGTSLAVSRLLLAFYFREADQAVGEEKSFEFTHKSFGEYLTTTAIVNALDRIDQELQRRQDRPGEGWDWRQALEFWASLCGPSPTNRDLDLYLHHEVRLRGPESARRW
jgi:hypothetical protein